MFQAQGRNRVKPDPRAPKHPGAAGARVVSADIQASRTWSSLGARPHRPTPITRKENHYAAVRYVCIAHIVFSAYQLITIVKLQIQAGLAGGRPLRTFKSRPDRFFVVRDIPWSSISCDKFPWSSISCEKSPYTLGDIPWGLYGISRALAHAICRIEYGISRQNGHGISRVHHRIADIPLNIKTTGLHREKYNA